MSTTPFQIEKGFPMPFVLHVELTINENIVNLLIQTPQNRYD